MIRLAPILATCALLVGCSSGDTATSATTSTTTSAPPTTSIASTTVAPTGATTETDGPVGERDVRFTTADGVELEGIRFGDGPVWVILAHMRPAEMESWFDFARDASESGYTALAFNYRGYGGSGGTGFAVDVDTVAAVDFAYTSGAGSVVVVGASMGGTGALAAGAERLVAGVATLSAPATFEGVDGIEAVSRLTAPALLVAATDDQPYASAIGDLAAAATARINTLFFDGNAHGTNLFVDHGPELRDQLLAFIASATQ